MWETTLRWMFMLGSKKITFSELATPNDFRDHVLADNTLTPKEQRAITTDYAKLYIYTEGLMAENGALEAENNYLRASAVSLEQDYSELVEEIENKG